MGGHIASYVTMGYVNRNYTVQYTGTVHTVVRILLDLVLLD